jgi:hypothetical protein
MNNSVLLSKKVCAGLAVLAGLVGNSAWAACTAGAGGTMWNGDPVCVDTVNNTETGLATTNTNLADGDTATLASSKSYTDAKALSVGANTLYAANAYTNAKAAETLKSANAYTNDQVQKLTPTRPQALQQLPLW